jgi:hypothetical protein
MKVRIAIEQEYDIDNDLLFLDDDPLFEENRDSYTTEERVDLLLNRFLEDIDYLVKYNEVDQAVIVEYIEE